MSEQVREIAVAELHGFKDHPFQVKDDESMKELCDSIQKYMQSEDCTPSLSQAVRMKKLSQIVQLTPERIFDIMSEEKANQKERVRLEVSAIRKYFPRSYTPAQMEQSILKMLDEQFKRRQRSREER